MLSLERVTSSELLRSTVAAKRPTQRDLQLGQALRNARNAAGVRQGQAAKLINCRQPTMARIEAGKKVPTRDELDTLLANYGSVQYAEIERLAGLDDSDSLDLNAKFDAMLRACEQARAIHTLHSERIPMTLQCERYALKQYSLFDGSIQPTAVLRLRDRRIRVLSLPDPPAIHAIMSVSSLLRMPGGQEDLVREQAAHLLTLLETTPHLTLHVLLMNGDIPYIDTDFTVIKAPNRRDDAVYIPFGLDGQLIKDRSRIDERETYWRQALDAALTADETLHLLRGLAKGDHSATTWPDSRRQSS
jgi:transcriptional regulator with XRE-family HTH domain